jgi:hypothetical protein
VQRMLGSSIDASAPVPERQEAKQYDRNQANDELVATIVAGRHMSLDAPVIPRERSRSLLLAQRQSAATWYGNSEAELQCKARQNTATPSLARLFLSALAISIEQLFASSNLCEESSANYSITSRPTRR